MSSLVGLNIILGTLHKEFVFLLSCEKVVSYYKAKVANVQKYAASVIEEVTKLEYFSYVPTSSDRERNNAAAQDKAHSFYLSYPVSAALRLHGENSLSQGLITQVNCENYLVPAECKFFSYDVNEIEHKLHLLSCPYDLVLLDPPWWNKYIRRKKAKCARAGYQMMYSMDLMKIPVANLTAPGSLVAVWCTNSDSHLTCLCTEVFPAWDIEYVGKWFWLKVTRGGEPVCQFSEPPGKQPFEQIVFGYKKGGKRKQPLPEPGRVILSVPSAIHSHKPPLSDVLAPYLPTNPRCMEIFARYLLPGWTSWGCEVLKLQHLSLYADRDDDT
ncbi:methyltransferase-like protein 4 isoform X2 [Zootermopsis nevadensis]|uniref:methyltransferase-like protein 4 isoform X2 n=1 Tax=Zootermopsis nevadensis TaxID=136037 RepID=UPI000B8E9419|nr:methyltransferase-like protein 4 isoform X2 [Zootermopsis nevadensis]